MHGLLYPTVTVKKQNYLFKTWVADLNLDSVYKFFRKTKRVLTMFITVFKHLAPDLLKLFEATD